MRCKQRFLSLLHAELMQRRSLRRVLDGSKQAREEHSPGRACWTLSWMCLLDQRQRKRDALFAIVVITCSFWVEDPTTANEYPLSVHSSLRLSHAREGDCPSALSDTANMSMVTHLTCACSLKWNTSRISIALVVTQQARHTEHARGAQFHRAFSDPENT